RTNDRLSQAAFPQAEAADAGLHQEDGSRPRPRRAILQRLGAPGRKKAIITGGDSGIGRAVAIAFAREGADVLISYLSEHEDADETKRLVEDAGRKAVLLPGDIKHAAHCRAIVDKAVSELGGVDILVN